MTKQISSIHNQKLQKRLLKRSNNVCSLCGSNIKSMNEEIIKYLLPDRTFIEIHRCNVCGGIFENIDALDAYIGSLKQN